jgi:palmitoyltransferase
MRAKKTLTGQQMRDWINFKTEEDGFAPLHFASFRGNLNMIEMLLNNGSDMKQENNFGINVLHVAA